MFAEYEINKLQKNTFDLYHPSSLIAIQEAKTMDNYVKVKLKLTRGNDTTL